MASLNCFLHPHHTTLMDHPHTFESFRHHLQDPYYCHANHDGHSHRGLVAPKFDVYGNETSYLLNGELPGVVDKSEVQIQWLANQTLAVRGWLRPEIGSNSGMNSDWNAENGSAKAASTEKSNGDGDSVGKEPKAWLRERQHGEFERSFTFPTNVKHEGVRARLENGILRITVLKAPPPAPEQTKLIPVG